MVKLTTQTKQLNELIAEFTYKRTKGIQSLIEQIEQIEDSFGRHSTKLRKIIESNLEFSNDQFFSFCEDSWNSFEEMVADISYQNLNYSFEKESVWIDVEDGRQSIYFYIESKVDFKRELSNLRKFGELLLPYASAEILEDSNYIENNYDLETNKEKEISNMIEFLQEDIQILESDLKDTHKYFARYIKPIKEVYEFYDDFMGNQVKHFKEWLESDDI